MTVKDIFDLRKAGKTEEAYAAILPMYKVHHGTYTTVCMFWCAVDMCRLRLEQKRFREVVPIFKSLLNLYSSFKEKEAEINNKKAAKPTTDPTAETANDNSAERSLLNIATEIATQQNAQRMTKDTPADTFSLLDFMEQYGTSWLTEEDYKTIQGEKHPIPSRASQIIGKMMRELKRNDKENDYKRVMPLLEKALQATPYNRTLLRYKAIILVSENKTDEALDIYKRLIQKGREAYIYSELADLLTDPVQKIAFTVKAIWMQRTEAFRQKDRQRLALLLAESRPQYARYELDQCIAQREQNNQHLSRQLQTLQRQLQNITPATQAEQQSFYLKAEKYAVIK